MDEAKEPEGDKAWIEAAEKAHADWCLETRDISAAQFIAERLYQIYGARGCSFGPPCLPGDEKPAPALGGKCHPPIAIGPGAPAPISDCAKCAKPKPLSAPEGEEGVPVNCAWCGMERIQAERSRVDWCVNQVHAILARIERSAK